MRCLDTCAVINIRVEIRSAGLCETFAHLGEVLLHAFFKVVVSYEMLPVYSIHHYHFIMIL